MAPVETELLIQADKLVGGRDAVLVIDDTAVLKKGRRFGSVLLSRILLGAGQDRQLSDPSIADAGARRSAGHGGNATVPSRKLDG